MSRRKRKCEQSGKRFFFLFKILPAVITLNFVLSCNNTSPAKEKKDSTKIFVDTLASKEPKYTQEDTIVIDKPAAVFFTADSAYREKLKLQMGEDPFDGVDHECFYQMKNAKTSLKEHWSQIQIYEVAGAKLLAFKKENDSITFIDLHLKKDLCGLYIFNRKKEPQLADMMGIGTSLEYYFLK